MFLKINLGSGGALLSDGEAGLKNHTSNLYHICPINQIKDASVILCTQKVTGLQHYAAFLQLHSTVAMCNVRRMVQLSRKSIDQSYC